MKENENKNLELNGESVAEDNPCESESNICGNDLPNSQNDLTAEKGKGGFKIKTSTIVKVAVFSALATILYIFPKIKLPMLFPSFLELQLSELPALICGFSLGGIAGSICIVLKILLKLIIVGTSTEFVGELSDLFLGLAMVLPSSIIYKKNRNIKGAIIGLLTGFFASIIVAVFANRFLIVPAYIKLFFNGNENALVGILKTLYPKVNASNFYTYYIFLAVIPFNALRSFLVMLITFLTYKRVSHLIKKW